MYEFVKLKFESEPWIIRLQFQLYNAINKSCVTIKWGITFEKAIRHRAYNSNAYWTIQNIGVETKSRYVCRRCFRIHVLYYDCCILSLRHYLRWLYGFSLNFQDTSDMTHGTIWNILDLSRLSSWMQGFLRDAMLINNITETWMNRFHGIFRKGRTSHKKQETISNILGMFRIATWIGFFF